MEKITSRSNEIIKDVKKLFTSRRFRAATGRFALEGARLCFDCLESGCPLLLLLVTQSALERCVEGELAGHHGLSDTAFFIHDRESLHLNLRLS